MKQLLLFITACLIALTGVLMVKPTTAQDKAIMQGPYQVVEGRVTEIKARMLVIDGQQYPISMFVRVFDGSDKGPEIPMHTVVGIGKIDKAKLLLLGGKVEKIIVLKNI